MTQMLKSFQNALPGGGRLSHGTESNKDFYEWRNKEPPQPMHGVNPYLVDRFYRDFVAVFDAGGFNEIEDGLTGLPVDMTPALTIHQSKGLEFPIVFICAQRGFRGVSSEHHRNDCSIPTESILCTLWVISPGQSKPFMMMSEGCSLR